MKIFIWGALAATLFLTACKSNKGTESVDPDARILAVIPAALEAGTLTRVSVAGEGTRFSDSIWLEKGTARILGHSVASLTDTGFSAEFAIPSDAATGIWDLVVYQKGGAGTVRLQGGVAIVAPTQLIKRITQGVAAGPQSIEIDFQGTRLLTNAPTVRFVRGTKTMDLKDIRVNSDTILTVTFVALPEDTGTWDVEVSQPGRILTGEWKLSLTTEPPSLVRVEPDSAGLDSDLKLTLTGVGTRFLEATSTVWLSHGTDSLGTIDLGSEFYLATHPLSNIRMEASFHIPPGAAIGDWDVHVKQPWYEASLAGALRIVDTLPQRVKAVSPSSAKAGDTLSLSITGAGTRFQQGTGSLAYVYLAKDGDTVYSSQSGNFRSMTDEAFNSQTAPIRADAAPGVYDVLVHYRIPAVGSGPDTLIELKPLRGGFAVQAPDPILPVPRILSVTPAAVEAGTLIRLTVTGENTRFSDSVWLEKGGVRIPARKVEGLTYTGFLAEFALPADAATGSWDLVEVEQVSRTVVRLAKGLVVTTPSLSIKRITPGVAIGPQVIHIDFGGTRLRDNPPASVRFEHGSRILTMDRSVVNTDTSLTAYFTALASDSGTWDVFVSQPGSILYTRWTLTLPDTPAVRLIGVSPDTAERNLGVALTITGVGTQFTQATETVWLTHGGDSLGTTWFNGPSVDTRGDTRLIARFVIPSGAALGDWDVHVRQPWYEATLPGGLYVVDSLPPRITAVSPSSAAAGESLALTITGARTQFNQGSLTLVHIFLSKDGDTVYHSTSGNYRFVGATSFSTGGSLRTDAQPGEYDVQGRYFVPTGNYVGGMDVGSWVELRALRKGFTIRAP